MIALDMLLHYKFEVSYFLVFQMININLMCVI